jgi:hypothetical protein
LRTICFGQSVVSSSSQSITLASRAPLIG